MAIARDTSATLNLTVSGGSGSQSYTMGAGSDGFLMVQFRNNTTGGDLVTGVSYGGQAMTLGQKDTVFDCAYFYYLLNPPTGANNIVITAGNQNYVGTIASYTGVVSINQTLYTSDASSASNTHAITPTVPNCWVVTGELNADGNPAAGTGANLVVSAIQSGFFDSNGTVTANSAYSMTITVSGGTRRAVWSMLALSPTAPANTTGFFNFMPN